MDHIEALEFLAEHQPMPPDDDLDEGLLSRFDAAWRALRDHPDPRAPRLLLNSFGDGSGFGVYQLVEDALRVQSRDIVVDALCDSLQSPNQGVRSWSAEIALDYPDERLDAIIPPSFERAIATNGIGPPPTWPAGALRCQAAWSTRPVWMLTTSCRRYSTS